MRLSCFGCLNKILEQNSGTVEWTLYSFHSEILSKNIARTARRQLNGQHLLAGVYLQTWADLYLLNFPKRCTIDVNLTSTEVNIFSLFLKLELF